MNTFDLILLVMACILVVIGMVKGLVRILVGLAALVAAFVVAARFHQPLADAMAGIEVPSGALKLVSYVLLFIGVMLLGGVLGYAMRKLLKAAMLSWADRVGGGALGLVAAMTIAALLILPMVAYSPHSDKLLHSSLLAPYVTTMADLASPLVPRDLSRLYRQRLEGLREFWRDRMLAQPEVTEI